MNVKKSMKRSYNESKEFMPLSKGNLFESDDEDKYEYDWGFKKNGDGKNVQDEAKILKSSKKDLHDVIDKKFAYKSADPLKLKDDDKQMYMENLTKIYNKCYVYIPSFYDVSDVLLNTDKIINSSVSHLLKNEIQLLNDNLSDLWIPLSTHYIKTNRLSQNCTAFKMIVQCLDQCIKAKEIYEGCLENVSDYSSGLKEILTKLSNKDVEVVTKIFREAVGDVLLKYKSQPSVSLEEMALETNKDVFMRMVQDDISNVKARVVSKIKLREKMKKSETEESEDENVDKTSTKVVERPASKSIMENKGLVPKRKKVDSNPRVKHRMKFKKAIVKYHSQVPRSREDAVNYQGEQSGIRIGVIKSKKFK